MTAGHVNTANIAALYANTTGGVDADPAVMDNAIGDIVQTINDNYDDVQTKIRDGDLVEMGIVNVRAYGASGSANTFTGSISAGSRTLTLTTSSHDFVQGQGISIPGAGAAGASLVTTVSSVQGSSGNLTLADAASTAATSVTVQHDDDVAVQSAVDYCQANNKKCYFPEGTYSVESISLIANSLVVEGADYKNTIIKARGATDAVFKFLDVSQTERFEFRNLQIDGNNMANYGVYASRLSHAKFDRVWLRGALVSGLSTGRGWCIDIVECELSYNAGNGFSTNNDSNNIVNIINTKIFNNDGFGIVFGAGAAVNIQGCTIETNKKGGLYGNIGIAALNIKGNYFEANGQVGQVFTTPALTVKADIILNGTSGSLTTFSAAFPCKGIIIEGNTFAVSYTEQAIYLIAGEKLNINNNVQVNGTPIPLMTLYGDASVSYASDVHFDNNKGFSKDINTTGLVQYRQMALSSFDSPNVQQRNYAPDNVHDYAIVASGGGGSIAKGDIKYNGFETMVITGAVNTDGFGFSINVDNYPELMNETVYFGAWVKQSVADINANLFSNLIGSSAQSYSNDTEWRWTEFQALMPATGTARFAFGKIGGLTTDKIYMTMPILAVVGTNKESFYREVKKPLWKSAAAPTTGTWEVNDRVQNSAPAAAGFEGWVCVTAGTPGTWKTYGAISA